MRLFRRFLSKGRFERKLDTELQFHLEELIREYIASGMSEHEARRKARLDFGALDAIKDDCRQLRTLSLLETTIQDIRYALRGMRKSLAFTSVVVLSLALGIGANTAIFTLIDAVIWRALPVKNPEELLLVGRAPGPAPTTGFTYKQFRAMRDNNDVGELAGYSMAPVAVSVDGNLEPTVDGQLVSGNYFSLLGVKPIAGRAIEPNDDVVPNGHPVAVISYGYWSRRFGLDPAAVGKAVSIGGMSFTIIGVAPPEFFGVEVGVAPDIFVPLMMQPTITPVFENLLANPIITKTWVQTIARLKSGVSIEQAVAVLEPLQRDQLPPTPGKGGLREQKLVLTTAITGLSELRRQFSQPLFVLMAIVSIVLLIACANTANLLLGRAAARSSEFAMRLALGSGRIRLLRQLIVESIVLAGFGGLAGILLARWATRLLLVYMSSGRNPIILDLNPDLRVLAFTASVSILTGILFGIAPALGAARVELMRSIKNSTGRGRLNAGLRPGKILTVVQVALSLLLLVTAGLFVRSLQNLNNHDSGFPRESVLVVRVEPKGSDQRNPPGVSARLDRIYIELLQRVREIPGVRSAGMGNASPAKPNSGAGAGRTMPSGETLTASAQIAYPGLFETLGMPIRTGRDLNPLDLGAASSVVCIVNETYARQFFPGEDPLGKNCGGSVRVPGAGRGPAPSTIVGIVKDSRYTSLKGETQAVLYSPFIFSNTGRGQMILFVRAAGDAKSVIERVRQEVWKADPTVPQFAIHTLAEEVDAALIQDRLVALLSSFFSALAMALACVGLYGLLSFGIVQRTGEMGVRFAMGATPTDVVWLIMREALTLVIAGVAIGAPLALAIGRIASSRISGLLFGVKANDPLTIVSATIVLGAVAALAAYLPARGASRVDPIVALRNE